MPLVHPYAILALGICTVLGLILFLRLNAFIALIVAALVVSLLAPPPTAAEQAEGLNQVKRVAVEFGKAAGNIGIVIALAAVIGQCMMESGAADRIVRFFLGLLGQKRVPVALMCSGFVLAIPVFFDTVFYLLVPLARSLYTQTKKNYVLCLLAIVAGGAITHTLVPPTPGPLIMAATLNIDLGTMILMGIVVGLPASVVGLIASSYLDRINPIPMRPVANREEPEPIPDAKLPNLFWSALPVVLPVLLITSDTLTNSLAKQGGEWASFWQQAKQYTAVIGDANLALLLAMIVAAVVYVWQRRPTKAQWVEMVEISLMSAGVIILITAAGGAFGAMLKTAQIGDTIKASFEGGRATGLMLLFLGFGVSALLKVAQGSSTVAMITGSAMLASMIDPATLGYHPVYLALAIGSGSLIGSWMNDSGFWIYAKMGGLTETEALRTWTILLIILGVTSMAVTVVLVQVLPLV